MAIVLLAAAACSGSMAARPRPLSTAVYFDAPAQPGVSPKLAAARVARAGATFERLTVYWARVAPDKRPQNWNPANPADKAYRWGDVDALVRAASARHLQVIVTVMAAPQWAQTGQTRPFPNSYLPDPAEFGKFATAISKRYSGSFRGFPRVRFWQAWNEPNLSLYLVPQLQDGKPVAPAWYRRMLNAFARSVRRVHRDNVVVAGGLAPFRDLTPYVLEQDRDWGPLKFARELLCMSESLKSTCSAKVSLDIWSQHPYTSGGPMHKADMPNDVSLGDLPEVVRLVRAAQKAGHLSTGGNVRFWVTEFSWDSSPPDPKGVPMSLLSRWTAEALYRMWSDGIELVTWLMLRDDPVNTGYLQSGLWFRGNTVAQDREKPMLEAFRFPVVAFANGKHIRVWGRTPGGRRGSVMLQQSFAGGWRNVGLVRSDRNGIFQKRYDGSASGSVRARLAAGGERSIPFSLTRVPDQPFNPFGSTTLLPPPSRR